MFNKIAQDNQTEFRGAALLRVMALISLLYLFLLAIAMMGGAFKTFGKDFAELLIASTTNPVIGLMIGLLATSLIQSSSGTTSIVVGLVAAGALDVTNAVPIIMGANMGTTVTNTVVALGSMNRKSEFRRAFSGATVHDFFNLMTIGILFPLEMATGYLQKTATWLSSVFIGSEGLEFNSPIKAIVKPPVKMFKHWLTDGIELNTTISGAIMLVVALVLLFGALALLTKLMRRVVVSRAEGAFSRNLKNNSLMGMLLGLIVTVLVQSSSITTSLMVPLVGSGILTLEAVFPVTLGANIGTTVTALLAAMTGNVAAVTVAFVHLLFNISGILLIYPFKPIRRIPIRLARLLALRTSEDKRWAAYYLLGIFFIMPLSFVMISKMF